ncbi:5-carboxymethyl-2-hydroxymuconate Delta-isomerase [Paraglaciecola arctica]|uniref:5-carboxymethyl-2-hydroxymuconate Delta-isomerase n=1 Tax=Paraglaciecola arctica TaxID=1128911 RepID=UPI001C066508|nr:5-carboxymethyl-2-hydroxymuconate Delta-isomerase [Paraglaciecola arctica]MBU3002902.1 5-carboxymethyl-2-hydroxymuconate Delta-isomerase [Paraglaciecola arctica]
MPHCIIEYSKNLQQTISVDELMTAVHGYVFSSGLFEESSIKIRAIEYAHYQTGLSDMPFVHLTLKILHGRNHQQKKELSYLVAENLKTHFTSPITLSVEVADIEKVSYKKLVIE